MTHQHVAYDHGPNWRLPGPASSFASTVTGYRPFKADDIDEFYSQLTRWRSLTAFSSTMREKIEHPSFRAIVEVGRRNDDEIIPLIIKELRQRPDFLVAALQLITGRNEAPLPARGNIEAIVDGWLAWADRNGISAD